ncbi:MAG: hypothetical protein OXH99_18035 [Bryobacterales bacterium]|nr:hypothetical protein [Bryobacterales bacterium]
MVGRFELPADPASGTPGKYEYDPRTVNLVYIDLNGKGDLTDEGPPSAAPSEVRCSSGEVVPYGIRFNVDSRGPLWYRFNSSWLGEIATPHGAPVLAGAVDGNGDGPFGLSDRRYATTVTRNHDCGDPDVFCVDLDRDTNLFCRDYWRNDAGPETISPENAFLFDGQGRRNRAGRPVRRGNRGGPGRRRARARYRLRATGRRLVAHRPALIETKRGGVGVRPADRRRVRARPAFAKRIERDRHAVADRRGLGLRQPGGVRGGLAAETRAEGKKCGHQRRSAIGR